jgi:hypothetical protein
MKDQVVIYRIKCSQQWKLKSTNFGYAKKSWNSLYRCGLTGWYRNMRTTCRMWSSSLTSVNGRTCLKQILKGPGLVHR